MKRNWIGGTFGWLWLAVVLLPIYFVLITSLKSISTYFGSNPVLPSLPLAFENVTAVLEADFTQYLLNSVLVAVGTVVPLVLMAFMASYSIVRGTRGCSAPCGACSCWGSRSRCRPRSCRST
jgi:raffinose/stachyose/melibiose transport system permease protein